MKLRCLLLTTVLVAPTALTAQIKDVQDCRAACSLVLTRVVTLQSRSDGQGYAGKPNSIARLADGSFLVADRYDQDRIKHYGADGVFLKDIGRRGKGPGEYEIVQFVSLMPGDSIEVYDLKQNRVTILSDQYKVARVQAQPSPAWEMVRFDDGGRIVVAGLYQPERVGLPLHFIDRTGEIKKSFGANPPLADLRNIDLNYRQLARASDSSVWSANVTDYRIEEWTKQGARLRVLKRNAQWFPAHKQYGFVDTKTPPGPGIMALYVDSSGLVWTLIQVPDSRWKEGIGPVKDPYGRVVQRVANSTAYFDTMVEVIDPKSGRVVGSARMDKAAIRFSSDGKIITYDDSSPSGEPLVEMWEARLPSH